MALGTGTDIEALLPTYKDSTQGLSSEKPEVGQIVSTVVPALGNGWKIFDASRVNHQSHSAISGTIREAIPSTDFRHKPQRLPIFKLHLDSTTELLAISSKLRPCVVLAQAPGISDAQLPPDQRNLARPAFRHPSFLVAPAFSASSEQSKSAITSTIAARAQCLVYPQMIFLPRSGGIIQQDSVVRLDRAFWTTLPPPSEVQMLRLSDERLAVVHAQMRTLADLPPIDDDILEIIELARSVLPDQHA